MDLNFYQSLPTVPLFRPWISHCITLIYLKEYRVCTPIYIHMYFYIWLLLTGNLPKFCIWYGDWIAISYYLVIPNVHSRVVFIANLRLTHWLRGLELKTTHSLIQIRRLHVLRWLSTHIPQKIIERNFNHEKEKKKKVLIQNDLPYVIQCYWIQPMTLH